MSLAGLISPWHPRQALALEQCALLCCGYGDHLCFLTAAMVPHPLLINPVHWPLSSLCSACPLTCFFRIWGHEVDCDLCHLGFILSTWVIWLRFSNLLLSFHVLLWAVVVMMAATELECGRCRKISEAQLLRILNVALALWARGVHEADDHGDHTRPRQVYGI
jgi:hypothetical protein